jgi:hypothetical protein
MCCEGSDPLRRIKYKVLVRARVTECTKRNRATINVMTLMPDDVNKSYSELLRNSGLNEVTLGSAILVGKMAGGKHSVGHSSLAVDPEHRQVLRLQIRVRNCQTDAIG